MATNRLRPNRSEAPSRPRLFDVEKKARNIRETFTSKPVQHEREVAFTWPTRLQYVGKSLGVGYASDKWKQEGDFELYLHLAESPNRALFAPDFHLVDYADPSERVPVVGPEVELAELPLPKHFAVLAHFEELRVHLFDTRARGGKLALGPAGSAIQRIQLGKAMLGASVFPWSQIEEGHKDQPFLFVYTEGKGGGVHMMIVGEELAVERDGIVG